MENKKHLIGKTKREILVELGEGYNFFPDNKWSYFQRKDMAEQRQNIDQATEFLKQIPQNASAPN